MLLCGLKLIASGLISLLTSPSALLQSAVCSPKTPKRPDRIFSLSILTISTQLLARVSLLYYSPAQVWDSVRPHVLYSALLKRKGKPLLERALARSICRSHDQIPSFPEPLLAFGRWALPKPNCLIEMGLVGQPRPSHHQKKSSIFHSPLPYCHCHNSHLLASTNRLHFSMDAVSP